VFYGTDVKQKGKVVKWGNRVSGKRAIRVIGKKGIRVLGKRGIRVLGNRGIRENGIRARPRCLRLFTA
jgi:hypothetical protein